MTSRKASRDKNRTNVENLVGIVLAWPLGNHLFRDLLHDVESSPGVDVHDEVIIRFGGIGKNRGFVDPSVIEQKVNFAELIHHVRDSGDGSILACHIKGDMGRLPTAARMSAAT